jgi:hypothetical protein
MLYLYTKEELRFRQPAQKFWEVLIEGNQSEIFFLWEIRHLSDLAT